MQATEENVSEAVKPVKFYAWIEHVPSSVTIHISGGGRQKDANGNIIAMGHKEVRFLRGQFETADPEEIAQLRKLAAKGDNITEDVEEFLKHTENPTRRAGRLQQKSDAAADENKKLREENERLKKKLSEKPAPRAANPDKD